MKSIESLNQKKLFFLSKKATLRHDVQRANSLLKICTNDNKKEKLLQLRKENIEVIEILEHQIIKITMEIKLMEIKNMLNPKTEHKKTGIKSANVITYALMAIGAIIWLIIVTNLLFDFLSKQP